ncbi:MAG TPA: hypothetical protein VFS00_34120 [Polyangiaceae bacterium]|nr:hypothetical protein [Polyangiaceae bacterium]
MSEQPVFQTASSTILAPTPAAPPVYFADADGRVSPPHEEAATAPPPSGWFRDVEGKLRRVDSDG